MPRASTELADELTHYGALRSQLVDVDRDDEPRVLDYLDLRAGSPDWRPPVVVESQGRPCVHVFDGRKGASDNLVARWSWRVALRGDGAWIGVVEPGILRVFRADVDRNEIRPVTVETASRGDWALPRFLNDVHAGQNDLARRRYLTKLLERSARDAAGFNLSQTDALSLVGRGLFWRFLLDRGLLTGREPSDVCDGAETWEQCLDNKSRALKTFRWLDATFNGGLLPFSTDYRGFDAQVYSTVLGNIAHGASETGQLRLPTDWRDVNFSYIPVGLLSEVYEAFAHNINADEAAERSIHYTPSHLVDFIVAQALEQLPEGGHPRVLDPAAGAGVFLVTALRKLVEREWRETGKRPRRHRIREILNRQLVGFDVDTRALRLAELALYLTALELDPKPKPLDQLTFDHLRGTVLFDLSEVEHGSLGPVEDRFLHKFDLVVGNPPWTAKARGLPEKRAWVASTRELVRSRLGKERADAFDLPDTNKDLPFVWRAMEWAKPKGRIALVTHARWLFGISERMRQARSDILEAVRVTGVLNGSALRLTNVWPSMNAPWAVVFATNEPPNVFGGAAFQFVSPALDTAVDSEQARLRIDWSDAETVLASEVVKIPWALKMRFRGNRLAARAFASMQLAGQSLGNYLSDMSTGFRNGYQVGGKAGIQLDASRMLGMPDTKGAARLGFVVNVDRLPRFKRKTLLFPRDPSIYRAPVLLVTECIRADRLAPRASRAGEDVAYHASFHGVSFADVADGEFLTRYLQVWLQSRVTVFAELMLDGRFGVERDAIYQESFELLPIVPAAELSARQRQDAARLADAMASAMSAKVADALDEFVFDVLGLSHIERDAVRDTVETALTSREAKRRAATPPTSHEQTRFLSILRNSLDDVLTASDLRSRIRKRDDLAWAPWRIIELVISPTPESEAVTPPQDLFLKEANASGASLVVVRPSGTTWFVGILNHYSQWTPTRARLLATDVIAERSAR